MAYMDATVGGLRSADQIELESSESFDSGEDDFVILRVAEVARLWLHFPLGTLSRLSVQIDAMLQERDRRNNSLRVSFDPGDASDDEAQRAAAADSGG